MKRITVRLIEKNEKWYAVINLYTADGRRKEKWYNLDLESKRGSKTEANHRLTELLSQYNRGELYLVDTLSPAERTAQNRRPTRGRLYIRMAGKL